MYRLKNSLNVMSRDTIKNVCKTIVKVADKPGVTQSELMEELGISRQSVIHLYKNKEWIKKNVRKEKDGKNVRYYMEDGSGELVDVCRKILELRE